MRRKRQAPHANAPFLAYPGFEVDTYMGCSSVRNAAPNIPLPRGGPEVGTRFDPPLQARFLRFVVESWHKEPSMRVGRELRVWIRRIVAHHYLKGDHIWIKSIDK